MPKAYLDHAATTPVSGEVLRAMEPFFSKRPGNASSLHAYGREAKEALDSARAQVASALFCSPDEIVFTSGGTESDNLAIKGACLANRHKGNHIITSKIEHPAVLATCRFLEKQGFAVTYLPVSKEGFVSPQDVEGAITQKTILVTVMHANNEIGTIQPIAEIGKIANGKGVLFHTDAVQTAGKIKTDVNGLGVGMLSLSAHKLYGPKGVGALFVRKGVRLEPLAHGGEHERSLRAGTENVAGIVGLGCAMALAQKGMENEALREQRLRDRIIETALSEIGDSWLNGSRQSRLPGNANLGFKYIEGEGLVLLLDGKGIAASTGSACSSMRLEPSHVLTAIGLPPEDAHGSLRLTLGKGTTESQVDHLLEVLPGVVRKLRKMSPMRKGLEWKGTEAGHG
ncbi:MAG: cysteine desulfurase NifS [Candidatus Micrarchaeia archaeon]